MSGTGPIPLVNINPAQYAVPQDVVTTQIDLMSNRAQTALNQAQVAIQAVTEWRPPDEPAPPDLRPQSIALPNDVTAPLPSASDFGSAGAFVAPTFEDLSSLIDAVSADTLPAFNPTIDALNIPAAPAPLDTSGAPERPTINAVVLPTAPDMPLPVDPQTLAIELPDPPTIDLPTFDADVPTFDAEPPDAVLDWAEPAYTPLVVNELAATIKSMLSGGYAMPVAVQDALVAAARSREDETANKAVQEAMDDFAARGFTAPPGMLAAEVSAVRQRSQLQANAASRDVFTKAAEWSIENLRTAVSQGIALESALMQQFEHMAQRVFDAARLRLQTEMDRFNLRVSAHNARLASINALVAVFDAKVKAELSKLQEFKEQIEAQQLKGQINEQAVRLYTGRLQALQTIADRFKTLLEGAKVQADVENSKIDLYKADVQAWAQKIAADKTRFDAYKSQVEGESAKAGLLDAEARAFAATVQGYESKNNIKIANVNAQLRAIETSVQKYTALVGAEREKSTAELGIVQARTQSFVADTQRYSAQISGQNQLNDVKVRASEASARNNVAYFEVVSRQFDARMERVQREAATIQEGLKSVAQMISQLAAGALSATHVAASMSNNAGTSLSASQSYNVSNDTTDYFQGQ